MWVQSLGEEHALEEGMATHSNILPENPMDRGAWHSESSDFSSTVLFARSLKRVSVGQIPVSTGLHSSWSLWGGLLSQPFVVSVWPHFLAQGPLYSSSTTVPLPTVLPHSHFPLIGAGKDDAFLSVVSLKMC